MPDLVTRKTEWQSKMWFRRDNLVQCEEKQTVINYKIVVLIDLIKKSKSNNQKHKLETKHNQKKTGQASFFYFKNKLYNRITSAKFVLCLF